MSENFLKFKKRLNAIRIIKSSMIGLSVGMALGGVMLILTKLMVIDAEPFISLYIGIGALLISGGLFFLLSGKSNKALAAELDATFDLKARVQTMIEFGGEEGEMIAMQRQDTDKALSKIPTKAYKFKHLPIYIVSLVLSAALLCGGIFVKNMRDYTPPEKIEAFELSSLQAAGLEELINYVEKSELEEEFKTPMTEELRGLLQRLRSINTKPDMQATLAKSMAVLVNVTYESSTATEMLDALWDTGEFYLKHLATVLDTSFWNAPDWGDFADKLTEYIAVLMGENDESENAITGAPRLKAAIDSMKLRLDMALENSGLPQDDEMYAAVDNIFNNQSVGLSLLSAKLGTLSDSEARAELETGLNITAEQTFAAISLNRTNALVGEYAMTRLAGLFQVPLPEFERPEFVKKNELPDGSQGYDEDGNEKEPNKGGLGTGAAFGSDDIVLDPETGNYEKYGELIHEYYTVMFERLQGDFYTEEQKIIIQKYFELLYGGLEEEGK